MGTDLCSVVKQGLALLTLCCSTAIIGSAGLLGPVRAGDVTCSPAQLRGMTGYFVSQDGFYGYPHRIEYLNVELDTGFLVATKLVGDRNVPRGKVSWRTKSSHHCASAKSKLPVKFQVRLNINDPNAFYWLNENHFVRFQDQNTLIVEYDCGLNCRVEGRLVRVEEGQALDAASKIADHD